MLVPRSLLLLAAFVSIFALGSTKAQQLITGAATNTTYSLEACSDVHDASAGSVASACVSNWVDPNSPSIGAASGTARANANFGVLRAFASGSVLSFQDQLFIGGG